MKKIMNVSNISLIQNKILWVLVFCTLIIFYVYLLFCLFSFLCTSHSFPHESTLHSFFCFAFFFFCTSLISFYYFFALSIFLFCFNIFLTTPNSFNDSIQSSVYIGMRIHLYIFFTMFCLFVFLTVLIWSQTVVFQHFSKNDEQGWLTRWQPWSFTNLSFSGVFKGRWVRHLPRDPLV